MLQRPRAQMATGTRQRTGTLTGTPGVAGKKTRTEAGTMFRGLVPMPHMVGAAAQRDCPIAADRRPLAGGAATLAGLAAADGVHERPARGVGPVVGGEADGAEAGSVVVEGFVVEGDDSPSGPRASLRRIEMVEFVGNRVNSSSVRRFLLAIGVAMVVPLGACNSKPESASVQAGPRTFASLEDAGKALAEDGRARRLHRAGQY